MKTILSILLLPIMALAQPYGQSPKEYQGIEFSMNLNMESALGKGINFSEFVDGPIELVITLEVYVDVIEFFSETPQLNHYETVAYTPPQYLSTLSLTGLYSSTIESDKPQERLNRLLALNDPMFLKENTLSNRLYPVRYKSNKLGGTENIFQGFGPLIRI